MRIPRHLMSMLLAGSATLPALASTDASPSPWSGFAELGSIWTSGNTDTTSINGKFELNHKGTDWASKLRLEALTSEEDNVTSKEKYNALVQFDRSFSTRSYLAIVGQQERDRFSGFEYQGTGSVGYGYRAIEEERMKLHLEAGPGYRRERVKSSGEVNDEAVVRLALSYHWTIRDGVEFIEEFSADMGDENSIVRSETGLKSQINGSLATKLTYKVKYVDRVPVDTENTDTEFGVTLVYSF